jgi:hypothetical protein
LQRYSNLVIAAFTVELALVSIARWTTMKDELHTGNRTYVKAVVMNAQIRMGEPVVYPILMINDRASSRPSTYPVSFQVPDNGSINRTSARCAIFDQFPLFRLRDYRDLEASHPVTPLPGMGSSPQ